MFYCKLRNGIGNDWRKIDLIRSRRSNRWVGVCADEGFNAIEECEKSKGHQLGFWIISDLICSIIRLRCVCVLLYWCA